MNWLLSLVMFLVVIIATMVIYSVLQDCVNVKVPHFSNKKRKVKNNYK